MMNSQERVLDLYIKLMKGKRVFKTELAKEGNVSEKTIQRDLELIRYFCSLSNTDLKYDKKTGAYCLQSASQFSQKEILAIAKIILEERPFNKKELDKVLDGLLALLSEDEAKAVSRHLSVERTHYRPLTAKEDRIDKFWDLSEAILQRQMLSIDYLKPNETVSQHYDVLLLSSFFDGHYFYFKAFSQQAWEKDPKKYIRTFRIDRILNWSPSAVKNPSYAQYNRSEDREYQNHQVDAFSGPLETIKIFYTYDPDNILDIFPDSKIIEKTDEGCKIEITTQDTFGLERKLMAEMGALTVLEPISLVNRMRDRLEEMQKNYKK